MTTERPYQKVKEILATVLERDRSERAAFLDARCGGDEALRREVESLLEHEMPTKALKGTPLVSIRPGEGEVRPAGERIGPYRIARLLGHGGMGEVYLAEQVAPVERPVALKLIHRGMKTSEILARFRMERRILASLNHPYIASLLHAAATEDGRPYFAMEYVEGEHIDDYCERHGLSIRQRLGLFLKVCAAVHFSHQKLVVHRDLKPANILVTADGDPKLLDFGIAKLLEPSPSLPSFTTVLGGRPMTTAYASPELFHYQPVTTASDVYSLGVLLYRLLTGCHPYPVAGRSDEEVRRIICEEEPKKPSAVASGPGRQLAGDLDSIVLKALRKEPQQRYGSVENLAEDIRRHLAGRPVAAQAATWRYRAGKFVRRYRVPLATAGAFAIVVAGFVVALLLQLERIQLERDRANMSRDLFVEIVETTDPRDEEENLAPEDVLKRGVHLFGESFLREREVQANVFDDLGRVYSSRGFHESSRRLLEGALQIRREEFGEVHLRVGESLLNLGQFYGKMGRYEKAEVLSRQGLEILREHYRGSHRQLAKAVSNYATQLYHLEDYEAAEPLYLEALEMKVALYGDVHLEVATSLALLGNLYYATDDLEQARQYYRKALDIRRLLLPPLHVKLGQSYHKMGTLLYKRGDFEGAEPMLRQALGIRTRAYGERHPDVAGTAYTMALVLQRLGRHDEAEALYRRALEVRCGLYGDDHELCAKVRRGLATLLTARATAKR